MILFQVSILINNAGIANGTKFMDTPDHLILRTMNVNVMSHFWVRYTFNEFCLHAFTEKHTIKNYANGLLNDFIASK